LNAGDAEDVGGVDIGAGIPGLYFFKKGNGFGGFASEGEGKAEKLRGKAERSG
jgi:hypothetical protein